MNPSEVFRQCAITKKKYARNKMLRFLHDAEGNVTIDGEMKKQGRSLHFLHDEKVIKKILDIRKRKMVEHFLKAEISVENWKKLQNIVNSL